MEGESVARALEVVGERWTLLILREAFFGVRRFGQLAHNLQIPRPTLSARLRTLVENGLLDKVPYARDPDRHEYQLTASGRDLFAAIVVLMRWGDEHLPQPMGPPIVLRHQPCGYIGDLPSSGQLMHAIDERPCDNWPLDARASGYICAQTIFVCR